MNCLHYFLITHFFMVKATKNLIFLEETFPKQKKEKKRRIQILLTSWLRGWCRSCMVHAWRPNGPRIRAVTVGRGSDREKSLLSFSCMLKWRSRYQNNEIIWRHMIMKVNYIYSITYYRYIVYSITNKCVTNTFVLYHYKEIATGMYVCL